MTFEEFRTAAEAINFPAEITEYGAVKFARDSVGVVFLNNSYIPIGCALCKYWSDDILLERIRQEVLFDGTAAMAYDYLELLDSIEREPNDNSDTDER